MDGTVDVVHECPAAEFGRVDSCSLVTQRAVPEQVKIETALHARGFEPGAQAEVLAEALRPTRQRREGAAEIKTDFPQLARNLISLK